MLGCSGCAGGGTGSTGRGSRATPAQTASTTTTTTTRSGPSTSSGRGPTLAAPCVGAPAAGRYDHVVWIWMENHTAESVLANASATYERALAASCGLGTNDHSVGSPSLPNYLGATSGSTWGIADDAGPATHPLTVDNLFRQVRAGGAQERSYQEAMPSPCALSSQGRYAVKHNPAAYYVGGGDRAACRADDLPLGDLSSGPLAAAIDTGTLPAFAFVTPDLCNDTHDCGVEQGDRWLASWVPRLVAGPDYRSGRTAVFVAWDEPTPMALIVIAPSVAPGTRVEVRTDHYGLLRTTEELLGLPLLGRAAGATSLRPLFGL